CGRPRSTGVDLVRPAGTVSWRRRVGKPGRHQHPSTRKASMQRPASRIARALFPSASSGESRRIGEILRKETVGGFLLVAMAALALLWANSPWADGYFALRDFEIGYEPWHLRLTIGEWAADGLLAIFFFLVGLELRREPVSGDLRQFSTAIVPVVAAVGGVVVPALIYVVIVGGDGGMLRGWAIPTATDIAFAVA